MTEQSPRRHGFTLIELVVVLAVVAIAATIVAPNLQDTIARQRLRSAANDIFLALETARIKTIEQHRGHVVTFAHTIDGTTYDLVIYRDENFDCEYETGEEVLQKRNFHDSVIIDNNGFAKLNDQHYIRWSTDGTPKPRASDTAECGPSNNTFNTGSVVLKHQQLSGAADDFVPRQVIVNEGGRVRLATKDD